MVKDTHLCNVPNTDVLTEQPKEGKFRQIVYDVETYKDAATGVLVPYCVSALRRCEECWLPFDIPMENCSNCGPRYW